MKPTSLPLRAVILGAAVAFAAVGAQAKTFKWTSASDIPTWDIHSQNNALANGIHAAVYESLVYYNSRTFKPEPILATGWKQLTPTQLRLTLRTGVKFHDGSTFSADDAVFSIERAMSKTSNFAVYTQGIDRVVKVNANTIDIFTKDPNPVLLNQLTELRMMSKAWAEKNKSVDPKDIQTKDENFAHRNANGTGPFMLKAWQPDHGHETAAGRSKQRRHQPRHRLDRRKPRQRAGQTFLHLPRLPVTAHAAPGQARRPGKVPWCLRGWLGRLAAGTFRASTRHGIDRTQRRTATAQSRHP